MDLINKIREQARQDCQRIVLPEGFEERTIMAADAIIREKLCYVYVIADPDDLKKKAEKYGLKNIEKATIINPRDHHKKQEYTSLLYDLRKEKGMTIVPVTLFINDRGLAKLEIALARGKHFYDKRDSLKDKDHKREIDRHMKNNR